MEGSRVLVRDMKNPGEKIGNDVWCELPAEAMQIVLSMPKEARRDLSILWRHYWNEFHACMSVARHNRSAFS